MLGLFKKDCSLLLAVLITLCAMQLISSQVLAFTTDIRVETNKASALADGTDPVLLKVSPCAIFDSLIGLEALKGGNWVVTGSGVVISSADYYGFPAEPGDPTKVDCGNAYIQWSVRSSSTGEKQLNIVGNGYPGLDYSSSKFVTFTAPATPTPAITTTNNTSNSTSSTSSSAATANAATSTTPPAVPVLESLKVGNTSFAAEKITENKLAQNEKKVFSGKTIPNGVVHLYFHSDPFEDTATADANGVWSYTLTKNIGTGDHDLQIAVTDPVTNLTSEKSEPIKFALAQAADSGAESKHYTQNLKPKENDVWYYVGAGVFLLAVLGILTYHFVIKHGIFSRKNKAPEAESPEKE